MVGPPQFPLSPATSIKCLFLLLCQLETKEEVNSTKKMSCGVVVAGQARVCALTALILLAFIVCGLCSSTCECDTPQVRAVLARFYNATGGPYWDNASGWTSPDPVCDWYGVVCAGANLTDIDLAYNNLVGTLPADLANITSIQRLNLSNNNLRGPLPPQWSAMTQMQVLRFDYDKFEGTLPAQWSAMTRLLELGLTKNQINGSLPPEWANMTQLQVLRLSSNRLSGFLPPKWGAMTNVRELDLGGNSLTGPLPPQWGAMSQLEVLYLQNNQIVGPLPPEWSNMTQLGGAVSSKQSGRWPIAT